MEVDRAFENLKTKMITASVLALPDMTETFTIETDAANIGIGVVLMQRGHLVAYVSKGLSKRQQLLSAYEKGLLSILVEIKKWHFYLIDRHFVIKRDHRILKFLLEQKLSTPLQHTWLAKLLGYNYEIVYKKGANNVAVDALSRV